MVRIILKDYQNFYLVYWFILDENNNDCFFSVKPQHLFFINFSASPVCDDGFNLTWREKVLCLF